MAVKEFVGKTVDEAVANAALSLSIPSSELKYTVVEEGSTGFFGIGSKPAKIEVSVKGDVVEEVKEAADDVKENTFASFEDRVNAELVKAGKSEIAEKSEEEPVKEKKVKNPNADPEAIIKKFLGDVFNAMGMTVEVTVSVNDEEKVISVDLSGEDMALIIGKRGQTLDSLQYLVRLVVNKEYDDSYRVMLDTENYRERRKETLESLAKNIAFKVKRNRRSVSLEPMNPYERRIIHSALQNDKFVATTSEGVDPNRYVVVYLKKNVNNNYSRNNSYHKNYNSRDKRPYDKNN